MFFRHFGLREQPFGAALDTRFLFSSEPFQETLASLFYSVECEAGLASLTGDPGVGKTALLHAFLEHYAATSRTALVSSRECHKYELIRRIASAFELGSPEDEVDALFCDVHDMLVMEARAGRRVILVLDDADALGFTSLETLRVLSNLEAPGAQLLRVVIAGGSQLSDTLRQPPLSLPQRANMPLRLKPLPPDDCARYIEHRLLVAGASPVPIFTQDALALVAEMSRGIPRAINRICLNAMTLASALKRSEVSEKIVRDVLKDLEPELEPAPGGDRGPVLVPEVASAEVIEEVAASPVTYASTNSTWGSQALALTPSAQGKPIQAPQTPKPQFPPIPIDIADRLAELRSEAREGSSYAPPPKKRSHRSWLIIAGAATLVLCLACAVFMVRTSAMAKMRRDANPAVSVPETTAEEAPTASSRAASSGRAGDSSMVTYHKMKRSAANPDGAPLLTSVSISGEFERAGLSDDSADEAPAATLAHGMLIRGGTVTPTATPRITPPALQRRVEPVFPPSARHRHMQGTVKIRLHLDKSGHVTGMMVLSGDSRLADPAEAAVHQWVFSPFQQNGDPIEGNTTVALVFASGE